MKFYKIRRKSDGKFARNWRGWATWGVGQVYSEKALSHAKRLYNRLGDYYMSEYIGYLDNNLDFKKKVSAPFSDMELIEYTMKGKRVVQKVLYTDIPAT